MAWRASRSRARRRSAARPTWMPTCASRSSSAASGSRRSRQNNSRTATTSAPISTGKAKPAWRPQARACAARRKAGSAARSAIQSGAPAARTRPGRQPASTAASPSAIGSAAPPLSSSCQAPAGESSASGSDVMPADRLRRAAQHLLQAAAPVGRRADRLEERQRPAASVQRVPVALRRSRRPQPRRALPLEAVLKPENPQAPFDGRRGRRPGRFPKRFGNRTSHRALLP